MKRFVAIVLALGLSVVTAGAQPAPRDPDLARAFGQIRAGDPEAALLTLDPLLRRWSRGGGGELALAHLCQGIAHAMLNAEPTARGAFREALRLDPGLSLDANAWPQRVLRAWGEVRGATPPAAAPGVAASARRSLGRRLPIGASDADVTALLARIEQTMRAGDPSALDAAFDRLAVYDIAMAGRPGPAALVQSFRAAAANLGAGIADVADAVRRLGSAYKLIRVRALSPERLEAVYRLIQPGGGANYFFYALERDARGPAIVDILALNYGRWESEGVRERWEWVLENARSGAPDPDAEVARLGPELERVKQLQLAGDAAGALAALGQLPFGVQGRRDILLWRATLAPLVGPREIVDAVSAFEARFPGDPAMNMLAIDAFTTLHQFDRALAALATLEQKVGGDAFLDAAAAGILLARGDTAGARARATRATTLEPTLEAPWMAMLGIALAERDNAGIAWALTVLETRFARSVVQLVALPQYADFVRSPEYASWLQARGAGPTPELPPPPSVSGPVRVGGDIAAPAKLVDVAPVYPPIALQARVQGVVILECTVSAQGDVLDARVLRSVPLLDQAAITAVKQWRYAPTLLNGVPVPVIMTVTVNFRLGDAAAAPATGSLVLYWPPQFWGKGMRAKIACDDGHVADLGQKRSLRLSAAPGSHTLVFEDRSTTFEVTAGGRHFIRVSASGFPPHGKFKELPAAEAEAEMREKDVVDNEAEHTFGAACGEGSPFDSSKVKRAN